MPAPDQIAAVDPAAKNAASVTAQESPAAPAAPVAPRSLQAAVPTEVPVTAKPITQVEIGFKLARIVLGMTSGSIVLFLIYLAVMDSTIGSDIREQYRQVLVPNRLAAEMMTTSGVEQLSRDLVQAKSSPAPWPPESQQNAQDMLKLFNALPALSSESKTQLKNCIPPPDKADQNRGTKLDACIAIVDQTRQAMIQAADAAADAKVAGDATYKIGEQRKDLHTFWVQAAQLVLLNLLLPLLTALFGYIFGRQQEQQ